MFKNLRPFSLNKSGMGCGHAHAAGFAVKAGLKLLLNSIKFNLM